MTWPLLSRTKKRGNLLLWTLLFPFLLQARAALPVPHRLFGPLQGQHINGVFADSRNRIWIGTNNGLYAWDGVSLAHYTTGDGLEDNEVLDFWGEQAGRLWVRTHTNRLCFVDLRSGKIINSAQVPALKIRSPVVIKSVSFGPQGQIYVLSDVTHITLLDPVARQVRALPRLRMPRHLFHPPGGEPLLLQGYSDEVGGWFHRLGKDRWEPLPPGEDYISCEQGRELYLFSPATGRIHRWTTRGTELLHRLSPLKPGDKVLKFVVFAPDRMALITQQQLLLLSGGKTIAYDCPGLNGIACDRDRNLWIAADDGLFFVPAYHEQLGSIYADSGTAFRSLRGLGDTLLLNSTNEHTVICDPALNRLGTRRELPGLKAPGSDTRWSTFLPAGSRWQIGVEMRGAQLHRRNVSGVFKELASRDDTAYLRTDRSLLRLYPSGDTFRAEPLSFARTTAMYLAAEGTLWFASLDSLYCHRSDSLHAAPLPGSHVVKIISTVGPFVLVSNGDHFVHVYAPSLQRYFTYSLPGPPGHYLEQIFDIGGGRKILKTNEYLYLLETGGTGLPRLRAIENLEPELHSLEDVRQIGDQVFLLAAEACYRYPFSILTAQKAAPGLSLEYIRRESYSGERHAVPATTGRHISLPSSVKSYSLVFSVDAAGRRQAEVQYALLRDNTGHPGWQPVSGNEVPVTLPHYGHTRIAIRARSASSGFGAPLYCDVFLSPPFWYDYHFTAACVLMGILLSVFITHRIFRRYARKKEEKLTREMQALQNEFRALNAMMNPHFIFNSLNSIQSFINTGDKKAANRYLQHFSRLIRQNMVNISANQIPVRQELEVLRHYLEIEQLRFGGNLQYSITVDREATNYCTLPPLLVQPLAENAILHGLLPLRDRQPELHVHIEHRSERLHITVRDNGTGYYNSRKQLEDRPSFGIGYIRKRLEKIEAMTRQSCHFSILSEEGKPGTTILMSLPAADD